MATWEQIVEANKLIKTTPIKGKDYAEVHQRIKAFRMVYPMGFVETKLVSDENGKCVFRAYVGYYNENNERMVIGTGTAYEKEGEGFINKTSYLENAETGAVGRALGMAGFGIDVSVASAEEVQNAIDAQEKLEKNEEPKINENDCPIDELKAKTIYDKLKTAQVTVEAFCEKFKLKKVEDLMTSKYLKAMNVLDETIKNRRKK